MGELQFGFHPYYRFPIIFLHLKGIAGHLYPGPSLWDLAQESDTYEPRDLRLEQAWARRPSGQAWNGSSAPHRSCWCSRDQWFSLSSIASSSSMVSSKVLPIGIEGMAFHSAGRMHDLGFLVPVCHLFNRWTLSPCWIYDVKSRWCLLENRKSAFFLECLVLGSLCVQ